MATVRVCFVCLGNICRSPTAHGIMSHLVREAGLQELIEVDSAGTAAYHAGEPPDERSSAKAAERGVILECIARRFAPGDFERFDYILAMDRSNYEDLLARAPHDGARQRVRMLRSFDPASRPDAEVPDPYYGGAEGFDRVFDICDAACRGLLRHLRAEHGL